MTNSELKSSIDTTYKQFTEGLKEIQFITDPQARRDHILWLSQLQDYGRDLMDTYSEYIFDQQKNKLKLMLARPVKHYIIQTGKSGVLVK